MTAQIENSTNEIHEKSLLVLAFPLVISFTVRSLFTLVDTLYASFLSDDAIAAISLAIPFEFIMIAIWVGTSTGLTSYLSKELLGKESRPAYLAYIYSTYRLLRFIIPGFASIGVGIYVLAPYTDLNPTVIEQFRIYGPVLVVGTAFTSFWSIVPDSIVKAHHDTRSTMIAGLLSNFINVALNTLFLFAFGWGIFGIALSTVLGRIGGLTYALRRAKALERNHWGSEVLEQREVGDLSAAWKATLKLGLPSALTYVLMSTESFWVNFLLSNIENSTAAIGAYGIYFRVAMLAQMPLIACSVAVLPYVARHSKSGGLFKIQKGLREANAIGILYTLLIVFPITFWGTDSILRLLTDTEALFDYGRFAIRITPFICLTSIPIIFGKPLYEGFQSPRPVTVLAILRNIIFAIPFCFLGIHFAPNYNFNPFEGLMLGLLTATMATACTAIWFTKTEYSKQTVRN